MDYNNNIIIQNEDESLDAIYESIVGLQNHEMIESVSGYCGLLLGSPVILYEIIELIYELLVSLEKLLSICKSTGLQVDEIGACLYPPQEVSAIRAASEKMMSFLGEMQVELEKVKGSSDAFVHASNALVSSLKQLKLGLGCSSDDELASEMENLDVGS